MEKAEIKEEKKIEGVIGNLISENRVVGFSDAVFAFAATLLVLKIDLPEIVRADISTQLLPAFSTLWPQYLANIISFLVIGYYWLIHHAIFSMIKKYTMTLVWLNIFFLIALSFLPFPIDLYGDFPKEPIVVLFFSASLAGVGFILAGLWLYASYNHRLIHPKFSKKHMHYYTARVLLAPIVFALSMPLVYVHPLFAQFFWMMILIGIIVINAIFDVRAPSAIEDVSI